MRSQTKTFFRRILARLLALVMLITMLPQAPFALAAGEEATLILEFQVKDDSGQAISGATIKVDGNLAQTTDTDGKAVIEMQVTEAGTVSYSVEANGYDSVNGNINYTYFEGIDGATASVTDGPITVSMTPKVIVPAELSAQITVPSGATILAVTIDGQPTALQGNSYVAENTKGTLDGHSIQVLYQNEADYYVYSQDSMTADDSGKLSVSASSGTKLIPDTSATTTKTYTADSVDVTAANETVGIAAETLVPDMTWVALTSVTSTDGSAKLENGALVFSKSGSCTVEYQAMKLNASNLSETKVYQQQLSVNLNKVSLDVADVSFAFAKDADSVKNGDTYSLSASVSAANHPNLQTLSKISYSIDAEETHFTLNGNVIEAIKLGEGTVTAKWQSEFYSCETLENATLKLQVVRGTQNATFAESKATLTVSDSQKSLKLPSVAISGDSASKEYGTPSYTLVKDGTNVPENAGISVNDQGLITITTNDYADVLGTYTVEVSLGGTDYYGAVERAATLTLTVNTQSLNAAFTSDSAEVTYVSGLTYSLMENSITVDKLTDSRELTWTYEITGVQGYGYFDSEGELCYGDQLQAYEERYFNSVAEINASTGELTINGAGKVEVTATCISKALTNYITGEPKNITAVFTLTVKRGDSELRFENEKVVVTSGKMVPANNLQNVVYSTEPEWSIEGVSADQIASVDDKGDVTLTNYITDQDGVTVKVTYPADGSYAETSATYQLIVEPAEPFESVEIDTTAPNVNNWYQSTDEIVLTVQTGYGIAAPQSGELATVESTELPVLFPSYDGETGTEVAKNQAVYVVQYNDDGSAAAVAEYTLPGYQVDGAEPETIQVTYKEYVSDVIYNGVRTLFYNANESNRLNIQIVCGDTLSGVNQLSYSLNDGETWTELEPDETEIGENGQATCVKVELEISNPGIYQMAYQVEDLAGNTTELKGSSNYKEPQVIVDTVAPGLSISYAKPQIVNADEEKINSSDANADSTLVYTPDQVVNGVATVTVDEDYFAYQTTTGGKTEYIIKLELATDDGAYEDITDSVFQSTVTKNGETSATILIPVENGNEHTYRIRISGVDLAGNALTNEETTFGTFADGVYTSYEILVDGKAPEVEIAYTSNSCDDARDGFFTSYSATVTVQDASFDPSVKREQVSGVNAKNEAINVEDVKLGEWSRNGDTWTSTIQFTTEANYTFLFDAEDNAGNRANITVEGDQGQHTSNESGRYSTQFTVDATGPESMVYTYSASIQETLTSGILYGFYSANQPLSLRVQASDEVSGVQTLSYTYHRSQDASTSNVAELSSSYDYESAAGAYLLGEDFVEETETFDGSKGQMRGQFSYEVIDFAGNRSTDSDAQQNDKADNGIGEIVDTIAPEASVTYPSATREYDGKLYYQANSLTIPITITEANFFGEDVDVELSTNGGSYVRQDLSWSQQNDTYTAYLSLPQANSYYNFKINYTDRSTNKMTEFVSREVILDTIAPRISVSYSGSYRSGDQPYYYTTATATITIVETNFLASEATQGISITAETIDGGRVTIPTPSGWSSNGNVHTCTIVYSTDARYTFDITYTDLANNTAADYAMDTFTVDKTAPSNLEISYSTDVWGAVTSSILWYDAPVHVTLTAYDLTSGVETITYNCPTKAGVSSVNVGVSEVTAAVNANSSTVTYDFQIPASVLTSANQFDGTVNFTATDRSGNSTSLNGTNELVVDNIAPNATITFTDPVSSDEDTDYYSTPFTATIEINEANFNADDVTISVEKDGEPYQNFTYSFVDQSVDVHIATITFDENGEYVIQVEYTDQSQNEMVGSEDVEGGVYTSRRKIVDVDEPVIKIEDMLGNQNASEIAYDEDKITFQISFEDENLLEDGLKVSIQGFMPQNDADDIASYDYVDETNKYVEKTDVITDGEEYIVGISNIEKDAVYFLDCSATDQAGNTSEQEIMFSVNRDGSTYYIDEPTQELKEQFYVNKTHEVTIHEISVEKLSKTNATVVRDATSVSLEKGSDYTVDCVTGQDNNWNDYTYTVMQENFESEGRYTVQTNSVSEKTEKDNSTVKDEDALVQFVMDTTAPEANISGIVDGGKYHSSEQAITITLSDNVMFDSATLYIDGVPTEITAEDLVDGAFQTAIPAKNTDQSVQVVAIDKAGNIYDDMDEINIRITQNIFFLYLEYWIVGIVILVILVSVLVGVVVARKKKNKFSRV